jgi:hypothetical protein
MCSGEVCKQFGCWGATALNASDYSVLPEALCLAAYKNFADVQGHAGCAMCQRNA